ncbi:Uncharacterised protein [Mycobacterium tuberculosis]|nr:Uncharacterised protein [Mycobacterium tuberculosis]
MHLQVVAVGVGREQLVGEIRDRLTHGHQLERQHVNLATLGGQLPRADEIGNAQKPTALLAREVKPVAHRGVGLGLGEHHDVVALGHRREIAVHHGGVRQDAVGGQPVQPVPQPRPALGLDEIFVGRTLTAALAA